MFGASAAAYVAAPLPHSRPVRIGELRSRTGLRVTLFASKMRVSRHRKLPCLRLAVPRMHSFDSTCFPSGWVVGERAIRATEVYAASQTQCEYRTAVFFGLAGRRVAQVDLLLPHGRQAVARLFPIPRSFPARGSFFAAAVVEPAAALAQRGHYRNDPFVSAIVGLDRRGRPISARTAGPFGFPPGQCEYGDAGF